MYTRYNRFRRYLTRLFYLSKMSSWLFYGIWKEVLEHCHEAQLPSMSITQTSNELDNLTR